MMLVATFPKLSRCRGGLAAAIILAAVNVCGPALAATGVFVGAGDIASCSSGGDEKTAALLDTIPGRVFTLGDNAYEDGTTSEFQKCYHPTWGRHKARTRPSVGNHEYHTGGAAGYFAYFGAAAGLPSRGYYSYVLGDWHVIALNSMCENVGGCGADSPMVRWLRNDLITHPARCTLAYFHHPLFSSGPHGNNTKMRASWDALYARGVDVVLSGHDHIYERFSPQRPDGTSNPTGGIVEFIVGTGGKSHYAIQNVKPNSVVRNGNTFGVLRLTLRATDYSWRFFPEVGKTFTDAGARACH